MRLQVDADDDLALFEEHKRNYQLAFGSPAGRAVLSDLVRFCHGVKTCAVPGDHDRTMLLEGRREVWLRIMTYIHMTPEQLIEYYRPPK